MRKDCLPCRSERGGGGDCQKESVVYTITCQECLTRGTSAEYTGETSRTGYMRGREHWEGLLEEKEDNPLWKHCVEHHDNIKINFKMKIVCGHKSPLSRQIHESVAIENCTAKVVMNSKGEWNGSRIPRIRIEVGENIRDEDEEGKDKTCEGRMEEWIKPGT